MDLRAFLGEWGLEVEGEGQVLADPELLALAVENVLDNARRHGKLPLRPGSSGTRRGFGFGLWTPGPASPRTSCPGPWSPLSMGGKGTGLGLALVAAVARAHGGRAWVENQDGAAVGLCLPLASLKVSPDAPFSQRG